MGEIATIPSLSSDNMAMPKQGKNLPIDEIAQEKFIAIVEKPRNISWLVISFKWYYPITCSKLKTSFFLVSPFVRLISSPICSY